MGLTITELMPGYAATVTGVDLKQPLNDAEFETVQREIDQRGVLVFPRQNLSDVEQVAFSRRFGMLEVTTGRHNFAPTERHDVSYISNVDASGKKLDNTAKKVVNGRGNEAWHTDSSFKVIPPKYSLLSGLEVPPEGGATEFADLRAAYDEWPGSATGLTKADLDRLVCEHSIVYSRKVQGIAVFDEKELAELVGARQLLIRRHPATGRANFYLASHIYSVLGWPEEKALALKAELMDWCTQRRFVYSHQWQTGDLVIWDNRCIMHRGTPWDREAFRRVMHRTTVLGDAPSVPADSPWALPDQTAQAEAMRAAAQELAAQPLPQAPQAAPPMPA